MRLADDARKCVVFFGQDTAEGEQYGGTGFFVQYDMPRGSFGYLVTCRHVARLLESGGYFLRVNTKDGKSIRLDLDEAEWAFHPDTSVDVAIVKVPARLPKNIDYLHFPVKHFTSPEKLASKDIGPGDLIYIVGLFRLIAGQEKNLPFVHTGHLALIPGSEKVPIYDRASQQTILSEVYLVEAQTLDGLSGSPVFVRRGIKVQPIEETGAWPQAYAAVFLLGVYTGAWDGKPGEILAADRTIRGEFRVPVGVGTVTPAHKILEVLELPEVAAIRDSALEDRDHQRAATTDAALPTTADNPQHKEDFTRLLGAAVRGRRSDDQT